ncbi:hypothetical protein ScalyP_jg5897 [Parmales sp. scaly parma]|nr:hypothetical protein ScalyP_jg5897 [Parmales sp. scaly parma]
MISSSTTEEDVIDEADAEDALMAQLEAENAADDSKKGPVKDTVAPTLLRAGAAQGQISFDDKDKGAKTKGEQLDFLLSKATEYSSFIAKDLRELQNNMADEAEENEKGDGKKRSKGANGSSKKTKGKANKKDVGGASGIFTQPKTLSKDCVLKDYQLEGIRWLTSLYENGVSGILADEMGLGKTIQVIALIAHLQTKDVTGPFLVVAPLATLPNWVREFVKWLPSLPVVRYHGTAQERDRLMKKSLPATQRKEHNFPVIITSYEVAIRDAKKLNSLSTYTYLIVDEGQRLKNRKCCLIKNLKTIEAHNRLLLSGTPIQNNLEELWSLLNFVNPMIFDDLSVFQSWFGFKNIGEDTSENEILKAQHEENIVSKLHEILRPFLLRRIKTDVLKDMPPKKEVVVYAGMSKLQRGYEKHIEDGTLRDMLLQQEIEGASMTSEINPQMNQRKNANHPFLFGEPIDPASGLHIGIAHPQILVRASGKFALLDRMLTRLHQDKHQVLIFSQMTQVLSIMEDYLIWRNWKYCRIDGTTKIDERQRQMDVFNAEKTNDGGGRNDSDDRHFVFLLSTRAGGLGINLASADTCIIFDSDWNPHQDSQAMDRCHRIGQVRPVAVYRLLTAGTVDITMMEKQISKKKLERMTIAGGDFRRAGSRSQGDFSVKALTSLLEDDIKDIHGKGNDIEHIKIDDEEFERIMNRGTLFPQGEDDLPTEGKMYDVLEQVASFGAIEEK